MATLTHLLPDGITIKDAAEDLGVTRQHLSAVLNLAESPSWRLAIAINKKFPAIERWMLKPELWGEDE